MILKNNQTEILEIKSSTIEVENWILSLSSRQNESEERLSGLEYKVDVLDHTDSNK